MKKLEGTYMLEWRRLPDGRVVKPPEISGLLTYTKKYRNFNVMWKDAEGKLVSISSVSKYSLDKDRYTETNIYYLVNDEHAGKGAEYDLSHEKATAKVKAGRDKLEFRMPLHNEPSAVIDKEGLVAVRDGEFEDHWKKVA